MITLKLDMLHMNWQFGSFIEPSQWSLIPRQETLMSARNSFPVHLLCPLPILGAHD